MCFFLFKKNIKNCGGICIILLCHSGGGKSCQCNFHVFMNFHADELFPVLALVPWKKCHFVTVPWLAWLCPALCCTTAMSPWLLLGLPVPMHGLFSCPGTNGCCYCFFFTSLRQQVILEEPSGKEKLYGSSPVNKRLHMNKIKITLRKAK